jgi:hypothetical protein
MRQYAGNMTAFAYSNSKQTNHKQQKQKGRKTMKRNMQKAINDYQKKQLDFFNTGDIFQIKDFAETEGGNSPANVLLSAIYAALRAGYVCGYRQAVRDAKKAK